MLTPFSSGQILTPQFFKIHSNNVQPSAPRCRNLLFFLTVRCFICYRPPCFFFFCECILIIIPSELYYMVLSTDQSLSNSTLYTILFTVKVIFLFSVKIRYTYIVAIRACCVLFMRVRDVHQYYLGERSDI